MSLSARDSARVLTPPVRIAGEVKKVLDLPVNTDLKDAYKRSVRRHRTAQRRLAQLGSRGGSRDTQLDRYWARFAIDRNDPDTILRGARLRASWGADLSVNDILGD